MLRFLALSLLLINLLYFGWSGGRLPGLAPEQQTEPQRLAQQLRPDAIRVLTEKEPRRPGQSPAAARPDQCLQAGPLTEAQGALLRPVLESNLPPASWTLTPVVVGARWIVYMGKYASSEALAKKRTELAAFNLQFEPLQDPALQFGLSLGGYESQDAANAALDRLSRRGIRTARVIQERAEARSMLLRLTGTSDALQVHLEALKPALGDKVLAPCP
ncbi:MAG: SPOR domain-containing protein [Rhodoferax sp.]